MRIGIFVFVGFLMGTFARADELFIPTQLRTGEFFSCALSAAGLLKCWGYPMNHQTGNSGDVYYGAYPQTMGKNLPFANLGTNVRFTDLCLGRAFSCGTTTDGKVKCWGYGGNGSLGQGSAQSTVQLGDSVPYTDLGPNFFAKTVVCGETHACALSQEGRAKCWGSNGQGQLGLGDTMRRGTSSDQMGDALPFVTTDQKILAIYAGSYITCAVFDDGARCWGMGSIGLGQDSGGDLGGTPTTQVSTIPPIRLEAAGAKPQILKLTAGDTFTCALYLLGDRRKVKCWGFNDAGSLGLGDTNKRGRSPNTMGEALPEVSLDLDDVVDIQAHAAFACAQSRSGKVKCWGKNKYGALGIGDLANRGDLPGQMGAALPAVDLSLPVKSLSSGNTSSHSCVVLVNNEVKCWGNGAGGALGYEDMFSRGEILLQMGDFLPFVQLN